MAPAQDRRLAPRRAPLAAARGDPRPVPPLVPDGARGAAPVPFTLVGPRTADSGRARAARSHRHARGVGGELALRTKMFRHTYCAARLQTLDRGAPVSTYTVARELGHESEAMVRRVYAHLGEVRHRSEVVEYRVAQHREQVGERLKKLGIVTGNITAAGRRRNGNAPRQHNCQRGRCFRSMGLGRVELPTSRLSGVRSNHLSYRPLRGRENSQPPPRTQGFAPIIAKRVARPPGRRPVA